MVDREVRQVEERVAHARILPVDDHEALAVVDEVGVEQVVVTRARLLPGPPLGDPAGQVVGVRERIGRRRASRDRRIPVGLHDLEGVEAAGDRSPAVEGVERGRDALELRGLTEALGRRDRPLDEARHEPALRLDEVDDVGTDAGRLGRPRRRELDRAVDAEKIGVPPRHAQHEHAVAPRHLHVVVGDASTEDLPLEGAVGPDAGDRVTQPRLVHAHARILSPAGS